MSSHYPPGPGDPQGTPPPPAYYQPQQYGYPPAYGYVPAPRTNVMAIVSLVGSLSTIMILIGWIPGIVCGHIALRQIRQTGEAGEGMAKAGLIVGYILGGLFVLAVVAYVLFFVFLFGMIGLAGTSASTTTSA